MNNALLHNNFNFNFSNQHSNPPAWKCGPFPKDSSNFLDFLVFSVFFFWPQFCPKLALWRVLELCWVQGLSGWILGAGRAQRRNEEKRGESRRDPRRIEETGRGESRTNDTRKGETRGIEEARPEKRGETRSPDPSPPRGPPGPPFNPPRGSRWLPGHTRPFCFIFGAFLFLWWKFFIFKKSACSICAAATELRNFSPTHFEPSVARGLTVLLYEGKQAVGVL